jgi:hypothetical protein
MATPIPLKIVFPQLTFSQSFFPFQSIITLVTPYNNESF